MEEKRTATRLKDENEISVSVVSVGKKTLKEKIFYSHSKDISVSGARIQANIFLPVNALIRIEMKLKTLHQIITVPGKVKWSKVIFDGERFEAGVEFFTPPGDMIKKLADYILSKQKFSMLYPV
ncbi:MAG: PilZ domain-containing protein [Smithella sp.]